MTNNLHKAAYDIAYSHLRRMERIKRELANSDEARSETHVMIEWMIEMGIAQLKSQFLLLKQFQAAKLIMTKTYPWKYEQPFWYRHNLHREFDWVTWGGSHQWRPIQHTRRPANKVQDEIPF